MSASSCADSGCSFLLASRSSSRAWAVGDNWLSASASNSSTLNSVNSSVALPMSASPEAHPWFHDAVVLLYDTCNRPLLDEPVKNTSIDPRYFGSYVPWSLSILHFGNVFFNSSNFAAVTLVFCR